jgi:hypothetical protein
MKTIVEIKAVVRKKGLSPEEIDHLLSEHALLMAANLHEGSDEAFLNLARLALMRIGAVEQ